MTKEQLEFIQSHYNYKFPIGTKIKIKNIKKSNSWYLISLREDIYDAFIVRHCIDEKGCRAYSIQSIYGFEILNKHYVENNSKIDVVYMADKQFEKELWELLYDSGDS
jgi:hypothetical protein